MQLCQDVEVFLEYGEGANDPNQLKNDRLWSIDMCRTTCFDSYQCPLHCTCPMAGESGWRPRGETFSSHRNLLLRQLTQEGGQDDKDFCPLRPKLWTNTVPRDKSQYGHLNKASKTTTNLIRLSSFKSSCEFGFIAYPKCSRLSIASRPFG